MPASGQRAWTDNQTLPGWYASKNTTSLTAIAANSGSSLAPGIYSLGSMGQSDRALGGFAGPANQDLKYGLLLVNNTGTTIPHLSVSFLLEQWYKGTAASESLSFFYRKGNGMNFNSSTGWTEVNDINASSPATGSEGSRNGNLPANQLAVNYTLTEINLAPGQQIFLKWQDSFPRNNRRTEHGLGIDEVRITPLIQIPYYAKSSGSLHRLTNWGINPDGSGSNPEDFTADNQVFYIHSNPNPTINRNWVVSGSNSKVVLGDGQTKVSMSIPANYSFQGLIDLNNQATLTLNNTILPTLGNLHPNSTLVLNTAGDHSLSATSFGNLSLTGPGTKSLAGNTTLSGTLDLSQGTLALQDFNLRLAPGATISGGSTASFVLTNGNGALERQVPATNTPVAFPIGNPTYNPVELSQTAAGTTDYYQVRVFPGAYAAYDEQDQPLGEALKEKAINRTWTIEEETEGGSDITLKLFWSAGEVLPNYKNQENQISHCDKGRWTKTQPKALVASPGALFSNSMSGISTFSPFISNNPDARLVDLATLPVRLLSFSATPRQQQVLLTWSTAMEQDNDYFAVEVSTDGRNFRQAGQVKGAGNSQQLRSYSFLYRPSSQGLLYFRLRQTDLDGQVTYSAVVAANGSSFPGSPVQVYPNPGPGLYLLDFPGGEELPQVQVSDLSGKLILPLQPLPLSRGRGSLDLRSQAPGMYLLTVLQGKTRQTFRLAKN